jgi:hypothetical protein
MRKDNKSMKKMKKKVSRFNCHQDLKIWIHNSNRPFLNRFMRCMELRLIRMRINELRNYYYSKI